MKVNFKTVKLFFSALSIATIVGCGESKNQVPVVEEPVQEKKQVNPEKAAIFKVGDEVISIPSPVQTAFLLKKAGTAYRNDILNDPKKLPVTQHDFNALLT